MLKLVAEKPIQEAERPINLDPRMTAFYKNLDRVSSVARMFRRLSPSDFSAHQDEVWDHMGHVLTTAVDNMKRIAGQLEMQMLINAQRR
jgi:hypothetical protein